MRFFAREVVMMIRMSGSRLAKHWHVHVVQVYRYSHVEIVSTRKREGGSNMGA